MLLVEAPRENPGVLELLEPRRQRVRADAAERLFEVAKFARPLQEQVAQDQDGPAVTDDVERARDRAFQSVTLCHRCRTSESPRLVPAARQHTHKIVTIKYIVTMLGAAIATFVGRRQ